MHLFIESGFLIDFEILFDPETSNSAFKSLDRIFREYTSINLYFDDESKLIEFNSLYYELITNYNTNPKVIGDFDVFLDTVNDLPNQTLFLTKTDIRNNSKVEDLGALYLTFGNFEEKIKKYLEDFDQIFDLSDPQCNFKWQNLGFISQLPFKSVVIDDSYILSDKNRQRINDNLIPLLKEILSNHRSKVVLTIYTDEVMNEEERKKRLSEIECVKKRHQFIQSTLSKSIDSLCILKSSYFKDKYDQHDRFIYTPFCMVSVGKGFNLFPMKLGNSSIVCSSIFKKATYNMLKNHCNNLRNTTDKLINLEVITTNLKIYPNADKLKLFID
jgi:hypothetical protein